jgi:hypothetical protein
VRGGNLINTDFDGLIIVKNREVGFAHD